MIIEKIWDKIKGGKYIRNIRAEILVIIIIILIIVYKRTSHGHAARSPNATMAGTPETSRQDHPDTVTGERQRATTRAPKA